jgi:acetyl-CoA carboxylase biotin carboxylase subunit
MGVATIRPGERISEHDHDGNLSFMEMNARIQVQHPVSEMITSVDLIQEQIRVAAGEKLSVTQDHVHGHAIECRVNAEDPDRDFAPAAGKLDVYVPPGGPWTRVDSHCYPAGPSSLTTTR